MVNTETSHPGQNNWRFTPTPFPAAPAPLASETAHSSTPGHEQSTYYGTSFPPDLYEKLRAFVQTKGWNTLLDGVTFRSGDRVVDLGFGDGGNTKQLAMDLREHRVDCVVFGVEKDLNMVQRAQKSYPRGENPNLIFINGGAEEAGPVLLNHLTQEESDSAVTPITRVISNYALHWVRDPEDPTKFLHREMFRSLNPLQPIGGEQRHFCAHRDAFKELFEAGYAVIRENSQWGEHFQIKKGDHVENNEWRHPPLITKDGIEGALRDAGYSGTATLQTVSERGPSKGLGKDDDPTVYEPHS